MSEIMSNMKLKYKLHRNYKKAEQECYFAKLKQIRAQIKYKGKVACKLYLLGTEAHIKYNCKHFWSFINSWRKVERIPTKMHRDNIAHDNP